MIALIAATLLGLRHATDPDHLTAVATLVLHDERAGTRRAATLGAFWGLGHAITLFAFGLPVVLFGRHLPELIVRGAEAAIGLLIAGLALRLLSRWRRGYFHSHLHSHGTTAHAHPHAHEHVPSSAHPTVHHHRHAESLGRTPAAALGIGLVHGVGGSGVVGVLLVAALSGRGEALLGLALFAVATALAMAGVSAGFGYAVSRVRLVSHLELLIPTLGTASLVFGVWYTVAALPV